MHADTYLAVERRGPSGWQRVADDSDFSTTLTWARESVAASRVTVTWRIDSGPGSYRVRYFGTSRSLLGFRRQFIGVSRTFTVQ